MHTIHGHATRQSELWCRASSEQEAVPEFGGQRPSPNAVLVVHMGQDLSDLLDGAVHVITIKKVLAVQLGDAASTLQVPPAYHHRAALTACSLTAGCTLQLAG